MTKQRKFVTREAPYGHKVVTVFTEQPSIHCPCCGAKGSVFMDDSDDYYQGCGYHCLECGADGNGWDSGPGSPDNVARLRKALSTADADLAQLEKDRAAAAADYEARKKAGALTTPEQWQASMMDEFLKGQSRLLHLMDYDDKKIPVAEIRGAEKLKT